MQKHVDNQRRKREQAKEQAQAENGGGQNHGTETVELPAEPSAEQEPNLHFDQREAVSKPETAHVVLPVDQAIEVGKKVTECIDQVTSLVADQNQYMEAHNILLGKLVEQNSQRNVQTLNANSLLGDIKEILVNINLRLTNKEGVKKNGTGD